jgi:hypothetical protein
MNAYNDFNYPANIELLIRQLLADPKYEDPKRLERFGFKAYSQNDEDGIIQEIFQRIGIKHHAFIEFGVGNGLENNTVYLLYQGWGGLWIDGSPQLCEVIAKRIQPVVPLALTVVNQFITVENINDLFVQNGFEGEIDLLCIDIDGNDYHIWNAIESVSPRVVVIEYNAKFHPPVNWTITYNPAHEWRGTDYFGASLKALEILGLKKGYRLVGCNLAGVNAFFVREDLVGDRFAAPFTAENHYHPPRYYLLPFYSQLGHRPDFGAWVEG